MAIRVVIQMISSQFKALLKHKEGKEGRLIPYREISQVTGLTGQTLIQWQYDRVHRFDAKVVEALCGYFECGIGDLLVLK